MKQRRKGMACFRGDGALLRGSPSAAPVLEIPPLSTFSTFRVPPTLKNTKITRDEMQVD